MSLSALKKLAIQNNIQVAYEDADKKRYHASPEALMAVLRSLGIPIENIEAAKEFHREGDRRRWTEVVPPVVVCRGRLRMTWRVPASWMNRRFAMTIECEDGTTLPTEGRLADGETLRSTRIDGQEFIEVRHVFGASLSHGYHQLHVEIGDHPHHSLVICAPTRVFDIWTGDRQRTWGVFLPLYALHSERSMGIGDLTDLELLAAWTESQGGHVTATLPLLASFWEESEDFSPYSPASRLFWNEYYLDVERLDGFAECPKAQAYCRSPESQAFLEAARVSTQVDYPALVTWKRRLLQLLADHVHEAMPSQRKSWDDYRRHHPESDDYARFRAACARQGMPWMNWPAEMRDGELPDDALDRHIHRRHLYVQWQMSKQLEGIRAKTAQQDALWYLDLPLGVNRAGYDPWRQRDAFALEMNGGAPPDAMNALGQNWCFPPLHPEGLRRQGYRYLISVLREQLKYARLLRIDHAACLHRMFWIPEGMDAKDGTYVRYPAEEWYAILALETHRAKAGIVGEDLGTVPNYITRGLRKHGIQSMYILPFETDTEKPPHVRIPGKLELAALNTHDMPTFAAFWEGADIDLQVRLGFIEENEAPARRKERDMWRKTVLRFLREHHFLDPAEDDVRSVFAACLRFMAGTDSELVLVNLEDLWQERRSQNVPGTFQEHPNWRPKACQSLESIQGDAALSQLLRCVNRNTKTHN